MTNYDPSQPGGPPPGYQPPPSMPAAGPSMPGSFGGPPPMPGTPGYGGVTMQRRVGKTRHPWGVWGLTLITFGIYGLVWYYKINRETHDFDQSIQVSPGVAVVAIFLGSYILVPPFVSVANTGGRISRCQAAAGLQPSCSGGLGILFMFLFGLYPMYYQKQMNLVWARYGNPPEGTVVG